MRLTDEQLKNIEVIDKEQKIQIGRGLFLRITCTGEKTWWLKYVFNKNSKRILLGAFPIMPVSEAWSMAMRIKRDIQSGINPSAIGKTQENNTSIRTRSKVVSLEKRLDALEKENAQFKAWWEASDERNYGAILRAEVDWLQEQIDMLNRKPKKKSPSPKKKKVPKKKKKGKR